MIKRKGARVSPWRMPARISKGSVSGFVFVINLFDLGGCEKLIKSGYKVENLIEFPGH